MVPHFGSKLPVESNVLLHGVANIGVSDHTHARYRSTELCDTHMEHKSLCLDSYDTLPGMADTGKLSKLLYLDL